MEINSKRKKTFLSFVPVIVILIIGGYIGNKILQDKDVTKNNEIANLEQSNNIMVNEIAENTVEQNQNQNNETDKNQNNINQISNEVESNEIESSEIESSEIESSEIESSEIENEVVNDTPKNSSVKFDSSVAFIGDSRTQGFIMYNGLKDIQDYSYISLMVDTAMTKKIVKTSNGDKITLLQDMANKNIKKVYIMLGINELGWSYPQVFKSKYIELIDKIREVKPNCEIYVQSIIPMTKSKSDTDSTFNIKNVEIFNNLIQEVANEKNVTYLDVKSALINENGYLPEEASTDGIHINKKYCEKWLEYLKNNS